MSDAGRLLQVPSAQAATIRVWVSLHGMATLRASLAWFPWLPRDTLLEELVGRAADLRTSAREEVKPARLVARS